MGGLHHITAIVGEPQENVDFYAGILGLRLVKQTVNFDDPTTYHFYFGNEQGGPGTLITFFPWGDGHRGVVGAGHVGVTTYAVPVGALPFWEERLATYDIPFVKSERFGEQYVQFADPHGLSLELVESETGVNSEWSFETVTPEVAIKGIYGATLFSWVPEKTGQLLESLFQFKLSRADGNVARYRSQASVGHTIDVQLTRKKRGQIGVGTVHHIAFRARDAREQALLGKLASEAGLAPTTVKDRTYFQSIYFREPGNILFEVATDGPGFAVDERPETLGSALQLPPQYERLRAQIERRLPPLK